MWLRNKKTGRVCDAIVRERRNSDGTYSTIVCPIRKRGPWTILDEYYSLAKLYEDWEDYKPAEPLIQDEKIRRAVRAWAKACNAEKAYLDTENEEGSTFYIYKFKINCNFIQIATHDHNPLEGRRAYTITELCGDEEE